MAKTPTRKASYNPAPLRRHVRLQHPELIARTGLAQFATKSFTRPEQADSYHPTIDVENGWCRCDCPQFTFRLARHCPTIDSPSERLCKHLRRALANLERRGLLVRYTPITPCSAQSASCLHCGGAGEIEVYDEAGNIPLGLACRACLHRLQRGAATSPRCFPAHIDPATGEIEAGWFQIVTPIYDLHQGDWVTDELLDAARTRYGAQPPMPDWMLELIAG